VEVFLGDRLKRREPINTGVVHQHIQFCVKSLGLGKQALDLVGLCDVGLYGNRFAPFLLNALDDRLSAGFAAGIIDDYGSALRRQMSAIEAPIPLEAPVTTATFPASFFIAFRSPSAISRCVYL